MLTRWVLKITILGKPIKTTMQVKLKIWSRPGWIKTLIKQNKIKPRISLSRCSKSKLSLTSMVQTFFLKCTREYNNKLTNKINNNKNNKKSSIKKWNKLNSQTLTRQRHQKTSLSHSRTETWMMQTWNTSLMRTKQSRSKASLQPIRLNSNNSRMKQINRVSVITCRWSKTNKSHLKMKAISRKQIQRSNRAWTQRSSSMQFKRPSKRQTATTPSSQRTRTWTKNQTSWMSTNDSWRTASMETTLSTNEKNLIKKWTLISWWRQTTWNLTTSLKGQKRKKCLTYGDKMTKPVRKRSHFSASSRLRRRQLPQVCVNNSGSCLNLSSAKVFRETTGLASDSTWRKLSLSLPRTTETTRSG